MLVKIVRFYMRTHSIWSFAGGWTRMDSGNGDRFVAWQFSAKFDTIMGRMCVSECCDSKATHGLINYANG